MRKIIGALIFMLSLVILLASMNQTLINKLKQDRYFDHLNTPGTNKSSWYYRLLVRSDRWRYGDLYGLCYLPDYKFKLEPFKKYPKNFRKKASNKILYIVGDSYLADKTLSGAFPQFDDVIFLDRRFPFGPIVLDSTKQNYLVLETSERNLINFNFDKTFEAKWTTMDLKARANFNILTPARSPAFYLPKTFWERLNNTLFNKNLSRNLELLLFDDKIFTPLKELKASINYKLFNRVDKDVAISTDKTRLLMNLTVDTASRLSGFRIIPEKEIDTIVSNLSTACNYYQSIGFKKVVLSIIPNPVSVYDEKRMRYNRLIQRVEQANRFTLLDIYNTFKSSNDNLYYRSDTHWNPKGFDLWVDMMKNNMKTW